MIELFKLEIPLGWKSAPMWTITTRKDVKGYPDAELLSVYREFGVIRKSDRDDNHNVESEDLSKYKFVNKGDLVLNKMKTWQGALGVSSYEGIVSPAYYVCKLNKSVHGPYIHYLLRSTPYIAMFAAASKGIRVGQWDLPYEEFRAIPVLLPPLEEQRVRADFLDEQLSIIDHAIEFKLRQIACLKEESKGLTLAWLPTSDKKHSDSWESAIGSRGIRAKVLFEQKNISGVEAPLASATMDGVFLRDEMVNDVWNPEVTSETYKLVEPEDFVIGLRSFQHGFSYSQVRGKVSPAYSVFTLRKEFRKNLDPMYFSYLFQTRQFISLLDSISIGIRQGRNIPFESFGNLLIPVPNLSEQAEIVQQQENNLNKINLLIKSIVPLKELKVSLIVSIVMGEVGIKPREVSV
jgi:type I restriction enzyme, S subunit